MKISAGILLYRMGGVGRLEVFLGHPGGPFVSSKDLGHWTILKGEAEPGEELIAVALREFAEESGTALEPRDEPIPLGTIRTFGRKLVHAWAVEGDLDPETAASNTFTLEWPPRSGREQEFPEIDRFAWFEAAEARRRINIPQAPLIDRLAEHLGLTVERD